ncbi:TRAP transporter substrate-binding protein [Seohaeicola sp. SP36]|jgi:TRAP-type C4-dicarboxylate transport system substrate-binding protein|uniref:TRAP transporter substrate-binding protein n=1 Tax=unclassified Seohaeicola TaxID=2641111 RepID=UPI00237AEAAC|nr:MULTISPECIES: TRAP transporter substrate-binding protein [unclassified Seohaeicola]MDD9706530.1 TRAP transporter substrate-binding protein [Seohaeicola sp. 4SK31]MDD9737264.1 TRAP transporter substrate-binding protein [Seohaeicola sp. SP36]
MKRRNLMKTVAAAAFALGLAPATLSAQEVTLRLHQFLPPPAPVPAHILKPWAAKVEERAGGALKIEHYDAMSLGGRPNDLIDQAIDGTADIIMTVVGYTPGRFPKTEVFELPFMMTNPVATAKAFWQLTEAELQNEEYKDVKILGAWVHGPGMIHSKEPIASLEDMAGKKLRGPTRVITDMLNELGATPVGMPLPAIPESLSKGVIDATVIPWEVTTAVRVSELVGNHTEFGGPESLYTATIILAMNKERYESLPENIRAAIDAESGEVLSAFAAQVMWDYDAPARQIAVDRGNNIVTLDEAEVARWKEKAQPVIDRWVADMETKGIDGRALIQQAKDLIVKNGG